MPLVPLPEAASSTHPSAPPGEWRRTAENTHATQGCTGRRIVRGRLRGRRPRLGTPPAALRCVPRVRTARRPRRPVLQHHLPVRIRAFRNAFAAAGLASHPHPGSGRGYVSPKNISFQIPVNRCASPPVEACITALSAWTSTSWMPRKTRSGAAGVSARNNCREEVTGINESREQVTQLLHLRTLCVAILTRKPDTLDSSHHRLTRNHV